jgi:hypothetical protein
VGGCLLDFSVSGLDQRQALLHKVMKPRFP